MNIGLLILWMDFWINKRNHFSINELFSSLATGTLDLLLLLTTGARFWKVPAINGPAGKAAVDVYIQGRGFNRNIINFTMFSSTKTTTKQNGMILLLGLALFFFNVDLSMWLPGVSRNGP